MKILTAGRQIGRTIKNVGRLKTIVAVFAKHGFYNILEQINLGRFIIERLTSRSDLEKLSQAERLRMSFEELGPTFVKLGQLLASRPDLVPEEYVNEFAKLHATVSPLPFSIIEQVLKEEFGQKYNDYFEQIDPIPLGSASIAQVHKAQLKTGESVVIKVQRPGLPQIIQEDLNVLYLVAELLVAYIPETRAFNPVGIVDEYFKTIFLETNFTIEANNIRRFAQNFSNTPEVKIPEVFFNLTTERVLTMEALEGIPLSHSIALHQPGVISDKIMKIGLHSYFKMVFIDGLFHGDLHAGNFFIYPDNRIGLIDFGVVGRLNSKTQKAIAHMLLALSKEDYEQLAYEYIDLAPFNEKINSDQFAKELRDLVAPYFGLTLKNVNMGRILLQSSAIAAKNHLQLPTELMLFFKSLVSIEGLGKKIKNDFDFLAEATDFAATLFKVQYDPQKVMNEFIHVAKDSSNLLASLPRQLQYMLRRINSPNFKVALQIEEIHELRRTIEGSFNLTFLGLIISTLILSSSYIYVHEVNRASTETLSMSFVGFIAAGSLAVIAFFNYLRK